jgi:hypothetical protein
MTAQEGRPVTWTFTEGWLSTVWKLSYFETQGRGQSRISASQNIPLIATHIHKGPRGRLRCKQVKFPGDEMWVLHFTSESKQQSMVWKHPGSPIRKKFCRTPPVRKLMLMVFWDCLGPLLLDFMPWGATINTDSYCGTLALLRADIMKKKRPGILVDNVVLLNDNARPHVANRTAAWLQSFAWEIIENVPYSPDLAPHFWRKNCCPTIIPCSTDQILQERHL